MTVTAKLDPAQSWAEQIDRATPDLWRVAEDGRGGVEGRRGRRNRRRCERIPVKRPAGPGPPGALS